MIIHVVMLTLLMIPIKVKINRKLYKVECVYDKTISNSMQMFLYTYEHGTTICKQNNSKVFC